MVRKLRVKKTELVKFKGSDNKQRRLPVLNKLPLNDFNDIIFENRNKDYGAYQLRRRYNGVVGTGIIIASLLVSLAVIIPFALRPSSEVVLSAGYGYTQVRLDNLPVPEDQIYVPSSPLPPAPPKIQEVVKYVPPVVVDSVLTFETPPPTADEVLSSVDRELAEEIGGTGFGDDLLSGLGEGDMDDPFFQVEVMPSFKGGGLSKFREWVGKRTNYPEAAIEKKIRGTVFLTFIVEKDGSVSNVTVTKGVHPLLDTEAVKAISDSPKWTPGLQRGQPVRVRFQIPVSFIY